MHHNDIVLAAPETQVVNANRGDTVYFFLCARHTNVVFDPTLVLAEIFCGENPLKAQNNTVSEIELKTLSTFEASNSSTIRSLIELMIEINPDRRPSASELLER